MGSSRWRPDYRRNVRGIVLAVWWSIFAAISFYWTAGGLWLVDTAVQEEGLRLAHERPTWFVLVVFISGVFKLAFVAFAYLIAAPIGRKIPRFLYLLAGWGIGWGCLVYGVMFSLPVLPALTSGDMTTYGWMRLLVWMPQFWAGGLLTVLTVAGFAASTSRRRADGEGGSRRGGVKGG